MAEKIKKWTLKVFETVFMIVSLILSVKLLGYGDYTGAITPIIVTALGIALMIEIGIKKAMKVVDKKFEMSDLLDGVILGIGAFTTIAGTMLFFGTGITLFSTSAGIATSIATIALLIQLFTN